MMRLKGDLYPRHMGPASIIIIIVIVVIETITIKIVMISGHLYPRHMGLAGDTGSELVPGERNLKFKLIFFI